jgi:peroxiredoxin
METAVLGARVVLALVFAVAAVAKLGNLRASRRAVAGFGVPDPIAKAGGTLLPFAELATAIVLIPRPTARWAAVGALVLLVTFIAGITNALAHGRRPDCNCFGQVASSPVSNRTVQRNALLAAIAALVVWRAPGSSITTWTGNRSLAELVAAAAVASSAILAVLAWRYWRQGRTLREMLIDARGELGMLPSGLPAGMLAPDFELPDVDGNAVSLESLCERDLPVMIVFTSTSCGPCVRLLPEIGRWHAAVGNRITFVAVSNGDSDRDRVVEQLRAAGTFTALVQQGQEVADAFRVRSTPMAVVVAPDRRIASGQAGGDTEIEALVRVWLRHSEPAPAADQPLIAQPA